jgi:hypothetical protein
MGLVLGILGNTMDNGTEGEGNIEIFGTHICHVACRWYDLVRAGEHVLMESHWYYHGAQAVITCVNAWETLSDSVESRIGYRRKACSQRTSLAGG